MVIIFQIFIAIKARTLPYPIIVRHKKEKYYRDAEDNTEQLFPSLHEEPTINLSVIVPAYNEEERCEFIAYRNAIFHFIFFSPPFFTFVQLFRLRPIIQFI